MADIVGAFGVPHTPFFPFFVERDGPECETARYYAALRQQFEALRPDLVVVFDTDHLNTFFLNNYPVFAVGADNSFTGPNDEVRAMPVRTVPSALDFATHLRRTGVEAGFDLAHVQEYSVDHSIMVPLHFLTPDFQTPVVPVFLNGHLAPLPSAERCYALGATVRRAVEAWERPLRVVTMGSGSFSLEVWGPRIAPGRSDGVPDPEWVTRVCDLLAQGDFKTLIDEATPERLEQAGNTGGELLNWIAMLGTIDPQKPSTIQAQMANGHAYAAWPCN